jgi:DNA mismatch repair protein MutS2
LAIAFLERLLAVNACMIVTTHATELKLFGHRTAGVANASVRFDPTTFAPTYALDVGSPGQSLAFPLARSLGINGEILDRAQALLQSQERDYEAALAELAQLNAQLQAERESVARELGRATARERELQSARDAFERRQHEFAEQAERRMMQALREFVAELGRRAAENAAARAKVTASQSALLDRTLQNVRADLGIDANAAPSSPPEELQVGDRVRVLSLRQEGELAEDFGDSALIAIGALKLVAKKDDLQRVRPARKLRAVKGEGSDAKVAAVTRAATELDVRGKRFVEAEPIVEHWIDEAVLAGNSPLRLIHGKGTGLLGRGLQEYLREHPSVESVRYGNADEGDGGVTIVELK